jgi:hypothetical protein
VYGYQYLVREEATVSTKPTDTKEVIMCEVWPKYGLLIIQVFKTYEVSDLREEILG